MTIYLFGDSFVENEPANALNVKDHKRWYDYVGESCNEKVINFGKCGTGQIYSMNKFLDLYEKGKFKCNDKFVFMLSSPYRIPWQWKNENGKSIDDSTIYQSYFWKNDFNFSDDQKYCLNQIYHVFLDEFARTTIKNIYLLKSLSLQNKFNIIVFSIYHTNSNPYGKKYNTKIYDISSINDEKFYYYPVPLFEHSKKEWKTDRSKIDEGMINHFSEKNHIILSNIIINHFLKTKLPTIFYEKFIVGINYDQNRLKDFIYE